MLKSRAGAWHISSTTRSTLKTPSSASPSIAGSENCTIGIPDAARAQPPSLCDNRCGAWSVATVAIRPSARATRRAARSSAVLMAGLHLIRVPFVTKSSCVNSKCATQASPVTPSPKSSSSRAVERWAICSRVPKRRARPTANDDEARQASSLRINGWNRTSGSSP